MIIYIKMGIHYFNEIKKNLLDRVEVSLKNFIQDLDIMIKIF